MDDRLMAGQHMFAGFSGLEIPEDFARAVREDKIGNVILFAHNVGTPKDLARLCAQLQSLVKEATGFPAFIAIDQEGGVVSRLGEDCTIVPSAMGIAATGDPGNAYTAGLVTARELRAMGVNFNLAPVADVNCNPENPVIGVRSYGENPAQAARFATAMMQGLTDGGVLSCAKHFPGHGDTAVDSHVGLPMVDKSLETLRKTELVPFQALIDAGVPGVMSTHILFPQLEKGKVPATMSREIMTGLLKENMGFCGLVLSDCMMMGAIRDYYGTVEGVAQAVKAGVDLVFVSHDAALAAQAVRRVMEKLQEGTLSRKELQASTEKILKFKAALLPPDADGLRQVGSKEHRQQIDRLYEQSLTAVNLPLGGLPEIGNNPLFIGCLPYVPTQASSPNRLIKGFQETLQGRFGGDAVEMTENPDGEEIRRIVLQVTGHSCVVAGVYNAHLRRGQLNLVNALAAAGIPLIVVALRNPYDLASLPEGVSGIAAWAYNAASFHAVMKLLGGEITASGTLPVRLKG